MKFQNTLSSLLAFQGTAWAAAIGSTDSSTIRSRAEDVDMTKLQYIPEGQKPRVFVMTDILNEPDDQQSVVRYLTYSNEFDTRALCAITSTWMRDQAHPEAIQKIVEAYGEVVDNLNKHVHPFNQYTPVDRMLSLIISGSNSYGMAALEEEPSEGALLLIERLQESTQPLWVLLWGGSNTLAQALKHMDESLPATEATTLRSRIRIYSISDQDNTGEWIRANYPDLFYIVSIHAFSQYAIATWTGLFSTLPHQSMHKVENPWMDANIELGPLGQEYPDRVYGTEGDSPSFLYLIPNGLGDPEHPTYGSWGGRWSPGNIGGNFYHDAVDYYYFPAGSGSEGYTDTNHATIARWRDHIQSDFAARIQWTLSPDFASAPHPPVPVVNGTKGPAPLRFPVMPGTDVYLDASATFNPDGETSDLDFEWYMYRESDFVVGPVSNLDANYTLQLEGLGEGAFTPANMTAEANAEGFRGVARGQGVKVGIPDLDTPYEYHLILQVTNNKNEEHRIRRYLRVMMLASRDGVHPDECCAVMQEPAPKTTEWE